MEAEIRRLRAALEKLKDDAWECRGALRRFEMDVREHVRNSGMTQATRMQLSRAADKADAAEKVASQAIESVSTILRTALSGEPGSAVETTASPQAPIARVTVKADRCYAVELYTPGLPPGEHDLYCEPEAVAPMMREKRAYYETHDPPHCPTCDCGTSPSKASERPAAVAHGMRHCPTCGEELGEDGHHKPDPVPPLI